MITAITGRNPLVSGRNEGPGSNFIDNEVKVYKLIDGVKTLVRTDKPYPDWRGVGMVETVVVPEKAKKERHKVHCPRRPAPPEEELRQAYRELGPAITNIAKKYGAGFTVARRWLREYGIIDVENRAMERRG